MSKYTDTSGYRSAFQLSKGVVVHEPPIHGKKIASVRKFKQTVHVRFEDKSTAIYPNESDIACTHLRQHS